MDLENGDDLDKATALSGEELKGSELKIEQAVQRSKKDAGTPARGTPGKFGDGGGKFGECSGTKAQVHSSNNSGFRKVTSVCWTRIAEMPRDHNNVLFQVTATRRPCSSKTCLTTQPRRVCRNSSLMPLTCGCPRRMTDTDTKGTHWCRLGLYRAEHETCVMTLHFKTGQKRHVDDRRTDDVSNFLTEYFLCQTRKFQHLWHLISGLRSWSSARRRR